MVEHSLLQIPHHCLIPPHPVACFARCPASTPYLEVHFSTPDTQLIVLLLPDLCAAVLLEWVFVGQRAMEMVTASGTCRILQVCCVTVVQRCSQAAV